MENQDISIKLVIADRQYPLKIAINEEESVRKAAKIINERSKYYSDNFSVQDKQDALAMSALEFATEIVTPSKNTKIDNSKLEQKIQELIFQIDEQIIS